MSDQRFAVLIGSGSYPNEPKLMDLHCPPRDVEGLAAALRSRGSFANVAVVKDAPHYEALLEVNRTLKRAGKEDLVFIYYSGHGKLDLANRLYLCTPNTVVDSLEATAIPVHSIRDYVEVASCYQVVLVLDCCFSGAAGGVFARSSVDDQLQLVSRGRGTYIMTASTAVQVALEKEQERYSAFTKHIVEGLETEAADVDEDGLITMDELYQYVNEQMRRENFQEPMKWAINVRGELLIARTGKTPRAERRKRIREKLIALAAEGVIPDRLLSKALSVLSAKPGEMTTQQRARDELLDRFDDGRARLGDFVEEWLRLDWAESLSGREGRAIERPPPEPEPTKVEGAPVPEPETAAEPAVPVRPVTPAVPKPKRPPQPESTRPAQVAPATTRQQRTEPAARASAELSLGALWPAVKEKPGAFWGLFAATAGGIVMGAMVFFFVADSGPRWLRDLGGDPSTGLIVLVSFCAAGAALGQWLLALRPRKVRWISATTVGWTLGGGLMGGLLWEMVNESPLLYVTLVGLLGAGGAGVMQSFALRSLKRRGAWFLIAGSAPLVGLPVGLVLSSGEEDVAAFAAMTVSLVAYAGLTSAGLVVVSKLRETSAAAATETAPGRAALWSVRLVRAIVYAILAALFLTLTRAWF